MMDINKLIEVSESFVNEDLLGTNMAWSKPIQIIEIDNRKFEIRLQSKLIEDEYGKI